MKRATDRDELILLPALEARPGLRGGLAMKQKYLAGAREYARNWPGPVTVLARVTRHLAPDADYVDVVSGDGEVSLEERPAAPGAFIERVSNAAVALTFLSPEEAQTVRLCGRAGVPLVYGSECSIKTELQIAQVEKHNPLRRWRHRWWLSSAHLKRIVAAKSAAGIHCNGLAVFEQYRYVNDNLLLYMDNRMPRSKVVTRPQLASKVASLMSGRPLRLVYSGRLVELKGVLQLPLVALELKRLGIAFTLDVFGVGELESRLLEDIRRHGLQDVVSLRGFVDFDQAWLPYMRDQADLFLCCHLQGCMNVAYMAMLSCGVPIVGYDNDALVGLSRLTGAGWFTPMKDPAGLACLIAKLDRSRADIAIAAHKGREYAANNALESVFASRVAHLVEASRLSEARKAAYRRSRNLAPATGTDREEEAAAVQAIASGRLR